MDLFEVDHRDIYDHSEVLTVVTWRSLLLISTKGGVCLRDLDNKEVCTTLSSDQSQDITSVCTFLVP